MASDVRASECTGMRISLEATLFEVFKCNNVISVSVANESLEMGVDNATRVGEGWKYPRGCRTEEFTREIDDGGGIEPVGRDSMYHS